MARDIDEKIVQMRFENSDFDKKAKETIKTLDNLNQSVDEMGSGAAGVDRLLTAIEQVNKQFGVMETIARGALEQIGAQAVSAGEKLVRSMTVDQLAAGWDKYGEKTRATKTIMNATGESIDTVNGYLEKLMWFTDETSYNFVDMTSNIGKFTSAGVALDTATDSMIGIANWAALAGQGANEASRAMYNLSQALGRGYVMWQDWMSVVNANMDTKEIKEMFIETAKAVGTLSEAGENAAGDIVTFGNFGETLSEGWLTTDVLNQTLAKYSDFTNQVYELTQETGMSAAEAIEQLGDAYEGVGKKAFLAGQVSKTFADAIDATADAASSRWMSIFELIFGNLEQQEVFWTDVTSYMYDAFVGGLDTVVEAMSRWSEMGGSIELLSQMELAMEGVVGIIQIFGDAWVKAFGEVDENLIFGVARGFEYFLSALTPTASFLDSLSSGLAGVLSVLGTVAKYAFAVAKGFEPLLVLANQVLGFFGAIVGISGDVVSALMSMAASEQVLLSVTETVRTVTQGFADAIRSAAKVAFFFAYGLYDALSNLTFSFTDGLGGLDKFTDALQKNFSEIFSYFGFDQVSFEGIFGGISDFFLDLASRIDGPLSFIVENLGAFFGFISEVGQNGSIDWSSLSAGEKVLYAIQSAVSTLAEGLEELSEKGETVADFLSKIMGPLGMGVREFLDYVISRLKEFSFGDIADVLVAINIGKLLQPIKSVTDAFAEMMEHLGSMMDSAGTLMEDFGKKVKADSFLTLAKAIAILAASLFLLSKVPLSQLAGTSAVLVGLGAGLTGFMYAIDKITSEWDDEKADRFRSITVSMAPLVVAILGLTSAVKKLAGLEVKEAATGVAAVGVLLLELAAFVKLVDGIKIDKKALSSLMGLAASIRALVTPIAKLGAMDLPTLAKGIGSVGLVIAEFAAFTKVAGGTQGNVLGAATGMIALAGALAIVRPIIAKFAEMDLGSFASGLLKFGAALGVLVLAMNGLSAAGASGLAGAAGLAALAASFALLLPQMALIAMFEWESVGKIIAVFAGVLGTFTIAGLALAPVGPIFVAVAAALGVFNLSVAAIIAALTGLVKALPLAAAGFLAFSAMSTEQVQNGVNNIGTLLEGLIDTFIRLKAKLKLAAITYLSAIIEALAELAPDIANGVLLIVEEILHVLNERLPDILVELDNLLTLITPYVEKFSRKAGEIAVAFIGGFLDALWDGFTDAVNSVGEWLDGVFLGGSGKARKQAAEATHQQLSKELATATAEAAQDSLNSFESTVRSGQSQMQKTGELFANPFLAGIDKGLDRHSPPGELVDRAKDSLSAFVDKIKDGAAQLGISGEGFAGAFSKGVEEKLSTAMPTAATSASESFVTAMEESGTGTKAASTIAKQLSEEDELEKAAKEKAEKVAEAFSTEFNKISSQLSAIGSKFGIAEAYLGPEDEEGKIAKQKQLLELQKMQEELTVLADKYNIAWDKYQTTLANPKSTNEEVQSMYAEYLGVYEEMAEKALSIAEQQKELYGTYQEAEEAVMYDLNELRGMQAKLMADAKIEQSQATQEAYNKFVEATIEEEKDYYYALWNYLKQQDAESVLGGIIAAPIDTDKLRKDVYAELGLDPNNPVASFMSVEELINQAVEASQQTYLTAVEATYPSIIEAYESKLAQSADEVLEFANTEVAPQFRSIGEDMDEATAEGITVSASTVSYSGQDMSKEAANATAQKSEDWVEVGQGMMNGVIDGIVNRRAEVIEAAIEVAVAALEAAKNALGIASPSKEFLAVGMYAMDGLRIGILAEKAANEEASKDVVDGMAGQFGSLSDRINAYMDETLHPVIDPTIDMTGVKRAVHSLDNLWSSTTLQTLGDISLSELRRQQELFDLREPVAPVVTNTNNFTQNNYSPKSLSDAEIYLQTKKELDWAFKGAKR